MARVEQFTKMEYLGDEEMETFYKNCLRFAQSHQPASKQSSEGCASSFAFREPSLASLAIPLPARGLLSSKQINASLAQQPSSPSSISLTPHSPVLCRRLTRALSRCMGSSQIRHMHFIPPDGGNQCAGMCMCLHALIQSFTRLYLYAFGGRAPHWTSGL